MLDNINLENVVERSTSHSQAQSVARSQPAKPPRAVSASAWLRRAWPTAVVLALIGGVAYWGHSTDWKLPKFSELVGKSAGDDDDKEWCKEHGVPESVCVECNKSLLPKVETTWCAEHEVHNCLFERPELAQLQEVPKVTQGDLDRAERALSLKERPANSPRGTLHERRIQFASDEAMKQMGVKVAEVGEGRIVETISASGVLAFEKTRVAPIFTPVAGRVWQVTSLGRLGAQVKKGDVLALIDSPEVGKAKAEFLQSHAQLELRAKTLEHRTALAKGGNVSQTSLLEAETAFREAQIRMLTAQQALLNLGLPVRGEDVKGLAPEELSKKLLFLGIPEAVASKLDPRTATANLIPVLASREGVVTAGNVVAGEMVDPAKTLFVVTDPSQLWLILHVRGEDVKYLRQRDADEGTPGRGTPGQQVRFRPDGSDRDVGGELVWISKAVDEKTRTVQVRAHVPNPDGKLLANTFGTGTIVLREEPSAVVVPNEALHQEKNCYIVFVKDKNFDKEDAPKVFHVREVRPGVRNGKYTEIIAGLWPGEYVATTNSAVLRAELLKGSLGGDND
jgi:cobalt-zinc-cadmium efflux system membrane fusion protein